MDWEQGIRESEIFLILGTESYFDDAICFCQAQFAKELDKPFRILLKKGVEIPEGFLDGVNDFLIEQFETQDDLSSASMKLLANHPLDLNGRRLPPLS